MAYIGNPPAEAYTNTVKDSFNGDGSTVAFTMSQPSVTNDVRVVVENVIQDPTVAYSCSGTTLTFTSAPPSGTNNIYVVHLGPAVMTTVPPSEIASATTFASAVTVQGAFTSQGIDDNATSTAMTLDASGNLLVGKTSTAFNTAGFELFGNADKGKFWATRDGGVAAAFNRKSSDGDIALFAKDGTTVGSIQSRAGVVSTIVLDPRSGGGGLTGGGAALYPTDNAGSPNDGYLTLGDASGRFKDLYLSGGVYLGGTGSANFLSDYETGTFTPTITGDLAAPTLAYTRQDGYYTKVGNIVHCNIYVQTSVRTGGSGNLRIQGLPFTSLNAASIEFYGSVLAYRVSISGRSQFDCNTITNTSQLAVLGGGDNIEWIAVPISGWNDGTTAMRISISYRVA